MLQTPELYIRRLEHDDLERTFQWLHRSDVYEGIGVDVPFSRSAQERWFAQVDAAHDKIVLALCLVSDDSHIGNLSLDQIDFRHRHARLSIFVGDDRMRGKGVGRKAILLLAAYAFEFLNLHRIWCKTSAGNEAGRKLYESLGFQLEGRFREHEFIDGAYEDKVVYGLLASEYRGRHRADV
jgi:RimJ/RimL family protein N-acetyltransferase